jgi:hypothetical protein
VSSGVFIGGRLIRRFDGFRRLCRRAAEAYGDPLSVTDADWRLVNRALAALGGPPAAAEVRGRFESDGLPLMLLFLLTGEMPCRIGLLGDAEPVLARLKSLVHLFGQAVYPTLAGRSLPFHEVVHSLSDNEVTLRPLVRYDDRDGEPLAAEPVGAAGSLGIGPAGGPYTLAVRLPGAEPVPLRAPENGLHPAILHVD